MAVNRTIVLKGNGKGHHDELVLDTVGTPGMHIQLAADGKGDLSPATLAECIKDELIILKEDRLQGKRIEDAYAIGDLAFIYFPLAGDHIHAFVKAGADIAVGDKLVQEGGGSGLWIEAAGTESLYRLKALEASGGALAANTHLKCRVVR